jgi:hypothetical protein
MLLAHSTASHWLPSIETHTENGSKAPNDLKHLQLA